MRWRWPHLRTPKLLSGSGPCAVVGPSNTAPEEKRLVVLEAVDSCPLGHVCGRPLGHVHILEEGERAALVKASRIIVRSRLPFAQFVNAQRLQRSVGEHFFTGKWA